MKIIKQFLILIMGAGLLNGCAEEEFLNVTNQNELNAANYYSRIENFDMALNGVYSAIKSLDLYGQNFYVETLLALPHESDYWNAQSRNEVTASDGNVFVAWRGWYRVVARANDVIENAPIYLESHNPSPAQREQLDQILGQAHFLRAFAYFHLVRLWGEAPYAVDNTRLAVPLILKVASSRDDMMQSRATVAEVYEQIISDFEAAETKLPVTWDQNNIARVNKFAAKGFLGKVYLYIEDYSRARQYFEEVINASRYSLVSHSRYEDLFQGKYEFSPESIFELNYAIDMQQNIWENGLGSGIALSLAPPGRGWSNVTPHGVNIERFGNDPRLEIATYHPEDSVATVEGDMRPAGRSEFNFTGHSFKKYVPRDYSVYSTNRNSGINVLIMRLADVYLMYAEVMNALGQDAIALEYLNKVRRRAWGYSPSNQEPAVDFTGLAGDELRDTIREERFRELFAEGHRWYDIVRWGIVEQEVLKYNQKRVTQGEILFQPKDYYYPIPQQEVDNNENIVPSQGYE
ncbi:RagB/SusD domain-containing protein [Flammeovirgaceae bacterium 311]|nr:RagB/SusD domain-containing protein [Flammeovirgaceae bacterium 311]